jgi:hypothetical protein
MSVLKRISTIALAAALLVPADARAQLGFGVACTPGIPGCTSVRFTFTNSGADIGINSLNLIFTNAWTFTAGGSSTVGTYSAEDSFGPFSGFTTISAGGTTASLNFLGDNGFAFELFAGASGYLDLEATGAGTPEATFMAETTLGPIEPGGTSVVPEPSTVSLLGAGFAALALMARRRKRVA